MKVLKMQQDLEDRVRFDFILSCIFFTDNYHCLHFQVYEYMVVHICKGER